LFSFILNSSIVFFKNYKKPPTEQHAMRRAPAWHTTPKGAAPLEHWFSQPLSSVVQWPHAPPNSTESQSLLGNTPKTLAKFFEPKNSSLHGRV